MRSVIFKIKVPVSETEYKEYEFTTVKDICEKLKIKRSTLYAILENRIKFNHESVKHLENIKIEKIEVPSKKKQKEERLEREKKEFEKSLIDTLDLK